jgi:hypothetical protein
MYLNLWKVQLMIKALFSVHPRKALQLIGLDGKFRCSEKICFDNGFSAAGELYNGRHGIFRCSVSSKTTDNPIFGFHAGQAACSCNPCTSPVLPCPWVPGLGVRRLQPFDACSDMNGSVAEPGATAAKNANAGAV